LTDLHDEHVAGEDTDYIVAFHDQLYGKAFGLVEAMNSTLNDKSRVELWKEDTSQTLLGGYEWLIHPTTSASSKGEDVDFWEFSYSSAGKSKECESPSGRVNVNPGKINLEKMAAY
jgi:hypothetical protein